MKMIFLAMIILFPTLGIGDDFKARWDGVGNSFTTGWVYSKGTNSPASCGHGSNCKCGDIDNCGTYYNNDTTEWWPNGCRSKIKTIKCTTVTLKTTQKPEAVASKSNSDVNSTSNNKDNSNSDTNTAITIGAAAAVGYGIYKLFTWEPSNSGSGSSYASTLKYGCKFCCEGQWGSCTSDTFQVNTPATNSADAKTYVEEAYKSTCNKYPFYKGGGSTASVGFPSCETYYYKD